MAISTGLKYLPGTYAKLDEIITLSEVAAKRGGIYTSHLREEGLGLIDAVEEAIVIADKAKIPVVLTHHKAMGQPMWGKSEQTLAHGGFRSDHRPGCNDGPVSLHG